MAEQVLTLCESCAEDMKVGGFRVNQINGKTTTEKKSVCENCRQKPGETCKQYIVVGKGR